MRTLALLLCFFAASVQAQSLPNRFMVDGVDAGDVLNIRSDPNATSNKIGEFAPFTLNVEVLEQRDGWGQVPTSEG